MGKSRKDAPPVAIVTIRMSLLYDNAKSKRFHRTFIRPIAYLFNPFVIDFTNDISRICAPCIIKFRTNPKTFLRKKCSCASSERFANIIKSRLRRTLFHSLATGNKPVGEISWKVWKNETAFSRIYQRTNEKRGRETFVRSSDRPFPWVSFDFLISRLSIESGLVETGEIRKLVNHFEPRFLRISCKLSGLILDRCVNRCNPRVCFDVVSQSVTDWRIETKRNAPSFRVYSPLFPFFY